MYSFCSSNLGSLNASASQIWSVTRGFFFEPEALDWIYDQYLPSWEQISDIRVSPIFANDFAGLPPTFVAIAECDILRGDIELYARKLREAGVPVETKLYEATIHGFTVMAAKIDAGAQAIDDCGSALKKALLG